jgi:hypothetical protein
MRSVRQLPPEVKEKYKYFSVSSVGSGPLKKWFRKVQTRAASSKLIVAEAWRPVVIEFCGIPRAGKTRSIKTVKEFLEHFGWNVLAPPEGASITPAELKNNGELVLFNIWAMSHALNSIIEGAYVRRRRYQAILLDRGLFDAVCWFTFLQQRRSLLNERDRKSITNFVRLGHWYECSDVLVLFTCDETTSRVREMNAGIPAVGPGRSTADVSFLCALSNQYRKNVACYTGPQRSILHLDTSRTEDPRAPAMHVVNCILQFVEDEQAQKGA